jgi:Fe-S-cluster containining protein
LSASAISSSRARGGCPFQSANLCSIHDLKPLACRVYFCDRTTDAWMTDTAERFHDRVRALHDRHNIPYLYAEWRDLLEMLIAAE